LIFRFITSQQEKTMHSRWEAAIPQAMQQHGGRNRAPVAWPAVPPPVAPVSSVELKRDDAPVQESTSVNASPGVSAPEGSKAQGP